MGRMSRRGDAQRVRAGGQVHRDARAAARLLAVDRHGGVRPARSSSRCPVCFLEQRRRWSVGALPPDGHLERPGAEAVLDDAHVARAHVERPPGPAAASGRRARRRSRPRRPSSETCTRLRRREGRDGARRAPARRAGRRARAASPPSARYRAERGERLRVVAQALLADGDVPEQARVVGRVVRRLVLEQRGGVVAVLEEQLAGVVVAPARRPGSD